MLFFLPHPCPSPFDVSFEKRERDTRAAPFLQFPDFLLTLPYTEGLWMSDCFLPVLPQSFCRLPGCTPLPHLPPPQTSVTEGCKNLADYLRFFWGRMQVSIHSILLIRCASSSDQSAAELCRSERWRWFLEAASNSVGSEEVWWRHSSSLKILSCGFQREVKCLRICLCISVYACSHLRHHGRSVHRVSGSEQE